MDRNFPKSLKAVLRYEGGYVDDRHDPGGATNQGITIGTFRLYIKPGASKADLKAMTPQQRDFIYRRKYWDAVAGAMLPSGVDFATFDYAVNSGVSRASKALQAVIGAKVDGRIGPETIRRTLMSNPTSVIGRLCDARMAFLRRLRHWPRYGRGWTNRVEHARELAIVMAQQQE